jgi:Ca2+/H+ antiporter
MESAGRTQKAKILERIGEYAIGVGLLAKGWAEAERLGRFPFRVAFIVLAGVFVVAAATIHPRLEKRTRNVGGLVLALEGLVEIVSATILLEEGKHWIPVFLAFIGLVYLSLGLVRFLAGPARREEAMRRLRAGLGIAFIVFAVVIAFVNVLIEPKIELFLTCAVMIVLGIFILRKRGAPAQKRLGLAGRIYDRLDK